MNKRIARKYLKRLGLVAFEGTDLKPDAVHVIRAKSMCNSELENFQRQWTRLTDGMQPAPKLMLLPEDSYSQPIRINQPEYDGGVWIGYIETEGSMWTMLGVGAEQADKLMDEYLKHGTLTLTLYYGQSSKTIKPVGISKFYQQGIHYNIR